MSPVEVGHLHSEVQVDQAPPKREPPPPEWEQRFQQKLRERRLRTDQARTFAEGYDD